MKIILWLLPFIPMLSYAQDSFTINAKIELKTPHAKMYLIYTSGNNNRIDSANIVQGEFHFKGVITEPVMGQLVADHHGVGLEKTNLQKQDNLSFYIDKGVLTITAKDSIHHAVIKDSKINRDYVDFYTFLAANRPAEAEGHETPANQDKYHKKLLEYIQQNPDSYFSLVVLREFAGPEIDVQTVSPIFYKLSPALRNSVKGKQFEDLLKTISSTSTGSAAPYFEQTDVNGRLVKLTDFKGKYVLIDFWASWCGPCRAENPNVIKAYNQFHDKGFNVLGVSLDSENNRKEWLAAIQKDGLTWTQVSDLQGWNNSAAKKYGIKSIPQNFLVDPQGNIIGKNLHGAELTGKLKEIFNN